LNLFGRTPRAQAGGAAQSQPFAFVRVYFM
jgi:hypothetical protein